MLINMYKYKLFNVCNLLWFLKMLEFKFRKVILFVFIFILSKLIIVVMGFDLYFIFFFYFYVCIRGWYNKFWVVWMIFFICMIVCYWNIVKNDFSNEIFFCVWKCCLVEEIYVIYWCSKFFGSGIVSVVFI